jgi:hypothetical protein
LRPTGDLTARLTHSSEEAKKKARRMLRQMCVSLRSAHMHVPVRPNDRPSLHPSRGIDYDEPPPKKWASRKGDTNSKSGGSNGSMSKKSRSTADDVDNEPEEKRRAAGYKATLSPSAALIRSHRCAAAS